MEVDLELIAKNGDGEFTLTCKGANSILVNDEKEVFTNDSAAVKPGSRFVRSA